MAKTTTEQTHDLNKALDDAVADLGFLDTDKLAAGELSVNRRRRRRRPADEDDRFATVTLTKDAAGVLRWEEGIVPFCGTGRRMRRGPGLITSGETVKQLKFEKLRLNEIAQMLIKLDEKLTPNLGKLRRVKGLNSDDKVIWETVERPAATEAKQRILVFIHGTFSSNDHIIGDELTATKEGRALLSRVTKGANKIYDEVLAFDHPTLSVSPLLNALDLAQLFADTKATVDVVCHSRGGLVTRWWLEVFERRARPGKVVLVGSPLGGTSLADPTRLRSGVEFLTNIGDTLGALGLHFSAGNPFLMVSAGLVKIISSVASLGAKLPLIDAAVAMIPGLAAQSRVANNLELSRLRKRQGAQPDYYAVKANFEPTDVSLWKFWQVFVDQPKMRAANRGVDFIFGRQEEDEGEIANDLVVNTKSMTELFGADDDESKFKEILDFKTTDRVYHTNYFRQAETIAFINKTFGIG